MINRILPTFSQICLATICMFACNEIPVNTSAVAADTMPSPNTTLWYSKPADLWIEALPVGNGRLGAMVFGGTDKERLQLNDITVWSGGPNPGADRPDGHTHLADIRKLIRDGRFDEAEKQCNQNMTCKANYDVSKYQTLGDLSFAFRLPAGGVTQYRRRLDIAQAVADVEFKAGDITFRREILCTAPEKALVQRMTADKPGSISFEMNLTRDDKAHTEFVAPDTVVMTGTTAGDKLRYAAYARVVTKGGTVRGENGKLTVEGADEATLWLTASTSYVMDYSKGYQGADPTEAAAQLKTASAKAYDEVRSTHIRDFQRYFQRVALDLGSGTGDAAHQPTDQRLRSFRDNPKADPALAALFFQYGRYLLISCSRPDSPVPANLQGLWADGFNTPWNGDYTININFQMNYWPAEPTGLSEMHQPMLRHIQSLVEPGKKTATAYFGPDTPGWVTAAKSNVWGWTSPGAKLPWGVWFGSNGWLCQHLWEHYAFTRDKEYLRNVYPTMKGACEFWLAELVEGTDGKLITSPSSSPENFFWTDSGMRSSVCEGAEMEKAIVWDLFDNTALTCGVLGIDADFRRKLEAARDRIRPPQVGKAGQLMEWGGDWDMNSRDMKHRHVSHLYGLHPGRQITALGTPALAAACRTTLQQRTDDGTGWSKAWKINFWARLRDGDHALKILTEQLRPTTQLKVVMSDGGTYPNLFDAHPPFQIDGNFGAISGIAEMLLQSHELYRDPSALTEDRYIIDLLPALPGAWPTGSVSGLRARGGVQADIAWKDGKLASATLTSPSGAICKVRMGNKTVDLKIPKGSSVRLDGSLNLTRL
ncbi:MAG: glycoside hydrolase N-terminal domain-containing protein [Candidatus Methylacidiphilales bacterium]